VIKADGTIAVWGESGSGGANAPSGSGYTKIYSTASAFAALALIDPSAVRAAKAYLVE
jgi:hypothetical protein